MLLRLRLLFLLASCGTLTSCGTASHYLGRASGLVSSITAPVTGILRLSDDTPPPPAAAPDHDASRPEAKRPH